MVPCEIKERKADIEQYLPEETFLIVTTSGEGQNCCSLVVGDRGAAKCPQEKEPSGPNVARLRDRVLVRQ